MDEQKIIAVTRRWIEAFVIGLNLCPFAGRVFQGERIRYAVTEAADSSKLMEVLTEELTRLAQSPIDEVETTLLIHPNVLGDFLDYNDFIGDAEDLIAHLGLEGVVQIAGFHPQYQF